VAQDGKTFQSYREAVVREHCCTTDTELGSGKAKLSSEIHLRSEICKIETDECAEKSTSKWFDERNSKSEVSKLVLMHKRERA